MPLHKKKFDILTEPTVASIHAFSPLPPRPRRKTGTTIYSYRETAPTLLHRHRVAAQYGMNREFRLWQLATKGFPKFSGDNGLPKNDLPKKSGVVGHLKLDTKAEKEEFRRKARSGALTYDQVKAQVEKNAHKKDNVVYLTPFEFEHRILDAMGIRRGRNSRPVKTSRSHHLTYEHLD